MIKKGKLDKMEIVKKVLKLGLLPKKLHGGGRHRRNYNVSYNEELVANTKYKFPRVKRVVIVAHPDDETIFAGHYLLHNRNDVLVVCLTHAKDPVRSAEFKQVMDYLNVPYLMFDFPDCEFGYDQKWTESMPLILEMLHKLQKNNNFEEVLTHNVQGEYGHRHHKVLHDCVKAVFGDVLTFAQGDTRISEHVRLEKEKMFSFYHTQRNVLKNNKVARQYFHYEGNKEE